LVAIFLSSITELDHPKITLLAKHHALPIIASTLAGSRRSARPPAIAPIAAIEARYHPNTFYFRPVKDTGDSGSHAQRERPESKLKKNQ